MRALGFDIEEQAKQYLLRHNLILIEANFFSRFGEIDLIMLEQDTLCFIEVRHRKSTKFGSAAESITPSKQHKIHQTALFFIQKNQKFQAYNCRFDAILSQGNQTGINFEWIKNAF